MKASLPPEDISALLLPTVFPAWSPSMEGLVAVGFPANTLQFIEFTCDLLRSGRELYKNGASAENVEFENITLTLQDFNDKLKSSLKGKAPQSTAWVGQDKVSPVFEKPVPSDYGG